MNKIPIVFAFDDNYALPASIAIKSLLDSKKLDTNYEIIVFHGGLKQPTIKKMNSICDIRWIKVDSMSLKNVPVGWSGLETYYRLFMADLLPEYEKVIWSDVDVLFKGDLSDIFVNDISNFDWAGIPAEKQNELNGIHTHFEENTKPFIYMPGFMIANLKLWREKNLLKKFFQIIEEYGDRLKMFDLDILNLAADNIKEIPFDYCVLENIYDNDDISNAKEAPWLLNTYTKEELIRAKNNPIIIHYAGNDIKIWLRNANIIPKYYWDYIIKSPFYNHEFYYPSRLKCVISITLFYLVEITCPIKAWRKEIRQKRKLINKKLEKRGIYE